MGPQVAGGATAGIIPVCATMPSVGFRPTRLHHDAGKRTEPPESVPSAPKHIRVATAAAEPLDEPPVTRSSAHGLRTGPKNDEAPVGLTLNSARLALARITAPACRRRFTTCASCVGIRFSYCSPAAVVRVPAVSI